MTGEWRSIHLQPMCSVMRSHCCCACACVLGDDRQVRSLLVDDLDSDADAWARYDDALAYALAHASAHGDCDGDRMALWLVFLFSVP